MKSLICKDVLVVDNIKGEFYLYAFEGLNKKCIGGRYAYSLQEQGRLLEMFNLSIEQNWHITKDVDGIETINLIPYLELLVNKGILPGRYLPEEKVREFNYYLVKYHKITNYTNNGEIMIKDELRRKEFIRLKSAKKMVNRLKRNKTNKRITLSNEISRLYVYSFKEAIISLLEQKGCDKRIVMFFKELTKNQGLGFDEYISNWVDKLKTDVNTGQIMEVLNEHRNTG